MNDILEKVKREEISFIDLMFSDLYGQMKCVTISPRELEDCLEDGKWFDGSSVEGFTRIHESDMLLIPDPSTYIMLPWPRHGKNAARIICDAYEPDRKPFEGAPRNILRRVSEKAREKGLERIELEVFKSNESAIGLYKKVGFEVEGEKKKARKLDNAYDDLVNMSLFI